MDQKHTNKRNFRRRSEDIAVGNKIKRFEKLYNIGQTITSEINMEALFDLVMSQTNQIMYTDRSALFLYDDYTDELWSLVATGMKKNEIRIKKDSGLAGWVFQNKKPVIVNDTYKDSRFNMDVDRYTGYRTKNILCVDRLGGELTEASGDGLMILFKSDTVKDHAWAAVAAGLEIVEENRRLNQNLSYPWEDVHLHMGINSGTAFVGITRMESVTGERLSYTASGLVTVIAARIGKISKNTKLFLGPETYSMVRDNFSCEFIGKPCLKNISEPTPIFYAKSLA